MKNLESSCAPPIEQKASGSPEENLGGRSRHRKRRQRPLHCAPRLRRCTLTPDASLRLRRVLASGPPAGSSIDADEWKNLQTALFCLESLPDDPDPTDLAIIAAMVSRAKRVAKLANAHLGICTVLVHFPRSGPGHRKADLYSHIVAAACAIKKALRGDQKS